MEKEKVGVTSRVKTTGLKNKGLIEVSVDKKTGDYVLYMSKGIKKKGLIFNLPEEMWKVRCTKDECAGIIQEFLTKDIFK